MTTQIKNGGTLRKIPVSAKSPSWKRASGAPVPGNWGSKGTWEISSCTGDWYKSTGWTDETRWQTEWCVSKDQQEKSWWGQDPSSNNGQRSHPSMFWIVAGIQDLNLARRTHGNCHPGLRIGKLVSLWKPRMQARRMDKLLAPLP